MKKVGMGLLTLLVLIGTNGYADDSDKGFEAYNNKQYSQAVKYFTKACDNEGKGCTMLGAMYEYGTGVKINTDKALKLYQKACVGGDGMACTNIGQMYDDGKGVSQNYFEASKAYAAACTLGTGRGCSNLGVLYAYGHGVVQDTEKAKMFFKQACEMEEQLGCRNYAIMNGQ